MSDKDELIDLLHRLHEYMENRSDADGDSEGYRPNEEMSLSVEISDMLYKLGDGDYGSVGRASVDPDYIQGGFKMESIEKLKSDFKRYL
jgi:hypothetical protein